MQCKGHTCEEKYKVLSPSSSSSSLILCLLVYFITLYQHEALSIEAGASDALQVIYFALYISAFKKPLM
jgi:hypothetical protein